MEEQITLLAIGSGLFATVWVLCGAREATARHASPRPGGWMGAGAACALAGDVSRAGQGGDVPFLLCKPHHVVFSSPVPLAAAQTPISNFPSNHWRLGAERGVTACGGLGIPVQLHTSAQDIQQNAFRFHNCV